MKIRKLISVLLVLSMVCAWIPMAAGAEGIYELTVNTTTTATIPEGEESVTYSFTPTETGFYTLTSISNYDTIGVLQDSNGNQLVYDDDSGEGSNFSLTAMLTAGNTYYYGVAFYSGDSGSFDILLTSLDTAILPLELNVSTTVNTTEAAPIAYYSFTPSVSGYYGLRADSNGCDTRAYLYDSNWSTVTQNDDHFGYDFFVYAYLNAGETYYYAVRFYSSYEFGSFTILLTSDSDTPVDPEDPDEPEEPVIPEEPEYMLGDVNDNGVVDIFDANLVVGYYNGTVDLDDVQLLAGDTDYNGEVDIFDANLIVIQYNASHTQLPNILQAKVSKTEFFVGEDALAYFYAEVTGSVSSVVLIDSNTNEIIATMLDDGQYSVSGDDLPNDNVYSCKVKLNTTAETTFSYVVAASYFETVYSEPITVAITSNFSDKQLADMAAVETSFQNDIYAVEGYDEMTKEARAELADEVLDDLAEQELLDSETVLYNDTYGIYTFTYSSGVLGALVLEEWGEEQNGSQIIEDRTPADPSPSDVPYGSSISSENPTYAAGNEVLSVGEAIVLWSFEQVWDKASYRVPFYQNLETELDGLGLETTVDWDTTVEDYKHLQGYEVIMISGHGVHTSYSVKTGWNSKETRTLSSLLLYEHATNEKDSLYASDLKQFRVGKISVKGGTMYAILPDFFTHYYDSGNSNKLEGSFIFAENCEFHGKNGNVNYTMADAFISASAEAVVGFHNSVMATYCRNLMRTYVLRLIDGDTAIEAYNTAVNTHGATDGYGAYPIFRGNEDALLIAQGILNGDFEQSFTPVSWDYVGDVRVLSQLGELTPSRNQRMAILTTGVGSAEEDYLAGTEGSVLSQTFCIPEDMSTLTFSYDVVSEEPHEFVGSQYNDAFIVKLLVDGETYIMATEDINTSVWYPISGNYFDGGDDTTYHTTWKTVNFDISAFAGKTVTIQFITYDVGDSVYDTAALIDNVYLN